MICDVSHDENEKLYETISLHSLSKDAEASGLRGSLSTPVLEVATRGQLASRSPKCRDEVMSPIYLSLEAESTSIGEA